MFIWTKRRKKWAAYGGPGLPGHWDSDCMRPKVQPFLFPSPQGWQQCYLRLCPLGLWLLITAGCLCEQPSGVKFTALCISTLCWAELPCTQAPWERGAAGQASPSSTQRQAGRKQPLLSSGAGVWAGLSLALQAWGESTGQQNSVGAVEVKTGLACSTNAAKISAQKDRRLEEGDRAEGEKPCFMYDIVRRMGFEAPAASGRAERAV